MSNTLLNQKKNMGNVNYNLQAQKPNPMIALGSRNNVPKKSRRKRGSKRPGAKRSKKIQSKWSMIKNRLSNIASLKKETSNRKAYLNLIENRNTRQYRKMKRKMLSDLKIDITKKYFLDFKFDDVKLLSRPDDSASNSIVYLLKSGNKQYILKITGMKTIKGKLSPPDTERRIYSIMSLLVDKNITPHVFTLTESANKEIKIDNINKDFAVELNRLFRSSKIKYVYPMITETTDSTKDIMTLYEFMKREMVQLSSKKMKIIFQVLLFQLIYTLHVFNLVGLKHNDLHLKNVFVQINRKNIITNSQDNYCNKYVVGKNEYLIPNIGIDIRIFDFDRTCKLNNGVFPEFGEIESTYLKELYRLHINCNDNPSFDTFKVLGELHKIASGKYQLKILEFILSNFFTSKGLNLLINDYYYDQTTNVLYRDLIYKGHKYYLMDRPLPESLMDSTENICKTLGEILSKTLDLSKTEVFQEFSTNFI